MRTVLYRLVAVMFLLIGPANLLAQSLDGHSTAFSLPNGAQFASEPSPTTATAAEVNTTSATVSVPKFDPALGTLVKVEIQVITGGTWTFDVAANDVMDVWGEDENFNPINLGAGEGEFIASGTVGFPSGGGVAGSASVTVPLSEAQPSDNGSFGGPNEEGGAEILSNLEAFVGPGQLVFPIESSVAAGGTVNAGSDDCTVSGGMSGFFTGFISVEYWYEPAP